MIFDFFSSGVRLLTTFTNLIAFVGGHDHARAEDIVRGRPYGGHPRLRLLRAARQRRPEPRRLPSLPRHARREGLQT